jgi:hypothetical protein
VLGLHYGLRSQPSTSPTSCSCRPEPNSIVLGPCSCRAKMSCFGLAHGPRAIWPSIRPTDIMLICTDDLFGEKN